MRYIDLIFALDFLYRYYPKYQSNELIMLAEDILKWVNNELPEDSSALVYLKSCFNSPYEAFTAVWKEIWVIAGSLSNLRMN
jgi:hypothetical protein